VKAEARTAGCDGFLLKPVSHSELISHIRRLLSEDAERSPSVVSG
jgi:DNA-binding NarL/FixJ family response regulator